MKMFSSCVLKLTAVCNLDCTYCYVFNLADRVYTRVPPLLSLATALRTLDRILEHLEMFEQREFDLTLHGGEPTMWPLKNFSSLLERVEEIRGRGIKLRVGMQTNAYRIDHALLSLLADHKVTIGISLDGPAVSNDRYRVDHAGRGSYQRVMATISAILEAGYERVIGGFLTVAQPTMEPEVFLDWVRNLPVPRADVLWPIEFHHGNPPWRAFNFSDYARAPIYGSWFARLFDLWWEQDQPDVYIRHFFQIIERMLGSRVHGDAIVNDELPMFVVNTDGGIEYPDYFRAYTDGGSRTRFSVFHNSLDEIMDDPGFSYCLSLSEHLPKECQSCPVVDVCGGGFLPGRLMPSEWPPLRKSVLCTDQFYFFSHVRNVVGPHIIRLRREACGEPLSSDAPWAFLPPRPLQALPLHALHQLDALGKLAIVTACGIGGAPLCGPQHSAE
ncbi:MAG: radical SAM protein [Stellaceae bacterium]